MASPNESLTASSPEGDLSHLGTQEVDIPPVGHETQAPPTQLPQDTSHLGTQEVAIPPAAGGTSTPEGEPVKPWEAPRLGFGKALHELGQSAQTYGYPNVAHTLETGAEKVGGQQQAPSWLNEPWELKDLDLWHRGAPKFLYMLGNSAPEIAAGIIGQSVGTIGGPLAPITVPLGSGIMAGGVAYYHHVGPYFAQELMKSPDDSKGAWERATQQARLTGALTGASFLTYGAANPFATAAANLAFQAGAIQPIIGMGGQLIQNKIQGQPLTSNLGQAYIQSGVSTAAPAVAYGAMHGLTAAGKSLFAKETAGAAAIGHDQAPTHKMAAENSNVHYDAAKFEPDGSPRVIPDQKAMQAEQAKIYQSLMRKGGDPRIESHNVVLKIIDNLKEGRGGGPVDVMDLINARSETNALQWQSPDPHTRNYARQAVPMLDDLLQNRMADVGFDPKTASGIGENIIRGNKWNQTKHQIERIDDINHNVSISPKPDTVLQAEYRKLAKDTTGFDPEVKPLIEQMAKDPKNFMQWLSEKTPKPLTWPLILMGSIAGGSHIGTAIAGTGAMLSKVLEMAHRSGNRALASQIENIIRWSATPPTEQPPQAHVQPPSPTRQGQAPTPAFIRPLPPQTTSQSQQESSGNPYSSDVGTYRRGGSVGRAITIASRRA